MQRLAVCYNGGDLGGMGMGIRRSQASKGADPMPYLSGSETSGVSALQQAGIFFGWETLYTHDLKGEIGLGRVRMGWRWWSRTSAPQGELKSRARSPMNPG